VLKNKNSKEKILQKALELFNDKGFANVSIRLIATELSISHSNLIYHYKTKNDIATALHNELLEKAIELNKQVVTYSDFMEGLFESTKQGFEILYDYRFLMIDLNFILKENEALKTAFLEIEKVRAKMYQNVITIAVENKDVRNELYPNEYDFFIYQIKIFSDSWIVSSQIYHTDLTKKAIVDLYADLFIKMWFPYLTDSGKKKFFRIIS